jgi:hypothetical protein
MAKKRKRAKRARRADGRFKKSNPGHPRKRKRARRRNEPNPRRRPRRARRRNEPNPRRRRRARNARPRRRHGRRRRRNPDGIGGTLLAGAAGLGTGLVLDVGLGAARGKWPQIPKWVPPVVQGVVGTGGLLLLHKHPMYGLALGVGIIMPAVVRIVEPMIATVIPMGDALNISGTRRRDRFTLSQSEMRAIQALMSSNPGDTGAIQAIEAAVDQAAANVVQPQTTADEDDADIDDDNDEDDDDDSEADLDSDLYPDWAQTDFEEDDAAAE